MWKSKRQLIIQIIRSYLWKDLICILFCIFLVFTFKFGKGSLISPTADKKIIDTLTKIPKADREKIEYFFRKSLGWNSFGYVLFGKKPMALGEDETQVHPFENLSEFLYAISPRRIKYINGLKAWKKYEKLFPISRFIFLYEETSHDKTVLLINKKNFIQAVKQHDELFKNVLGCEVSGEKLLAEASNYCLINEVLKNHDVLIGILLGYGSTNALLFHQRAQLDSENERRDFNKRFNFGDPWKKEFQEFLKKFESVNWVSAFITGSHLKNLELTPLPGFCAVLEHPETLHLKHHYIETREKMIKYFKGKDFLASFLTILTSHEE